MMTDRPETESHEEAFETRPLKPPLAGIARQPIRYGEKSALPIVMPFLLNRLVALSFPAFFALQQVALAQPRPVAPVNPSVASKVQLLFVQNSAATAIDAAKGILTLKNVAPSTLFFADRPVRMAGHYHTKEEFLKLWVGSPDSFSRNPPNATLSIVEPGQPDLTNVVVQLRNPRLNGNDLLYDIKLVEGVLPPSGEAAVLFIDVLGVWRRNLRCVAIVGTSTAVAASAAASASEATAAEAAAAKAQAAAAQASTATPPAAAMVPAPSPSQKLAQLKGMLQEGLITPAQYQKASQELLNQFVQ
jgi:hypothetical protein